MLPLMLTSKKQPLPGPQVHRTEDDAMGVPARDEHSGWFAASTPVGAQRWKEKQIGLVFCQKHAAMWQVPDSAADSSFFSRAPDPVPTRIEAASTGNPVGSTHGVSCGPRTSCQCTIPTDLEAEARSSSPQSSRVPLESVSGKSVTIPSIPRSRQAVVLNALHHATTRDPKILYTVQSSGKYWDGSHARCARSPSLNVPDRIPERRASADTTEHPANSSVAFPTDDAAGMTNAISSWKHHRLRIERIRLGSRV